MKKVLVITLLAVLSLGCVFAQSIHEEAKGMQRVIILNNAFEGLEATSQCYNAKEWHKSYNLGEMIDANFWFKPAADTTVSIVSYADLYADNVDLKSFRGKYVSFVKDNPAYDYDLFVGPNQKESMDVFYKGWCVVGQEAFVFMQEEGIQDLVYVAENVGFVPAWVYEFVNVDGEKLDVKVEDLATAQIVFEGDRVVTLVVGDQKLANVKYVVPAGITADSQIGAEGVYKLDLALNCDGVYGVEAPYLQNRAGTYYPTAKTADHKYAGSYSVAEMFAKFNVKPCASVEVIAYTDGFAREEEYEHFAKKYIAWHATAEYITIGQEQSKKEDAVWNAGYYILDEDSFAYIPEAGLAVADIIEKTGLAQVCQYKLTFADGSTKLAYYEDLAEMKLAADSNLVSIEVN